MPAHDDLCAEILPRRRRHAAAHTLYSMTLTSWTRTKGDPIMRKRMHRDTAKARVERAIDAMAPGVAEQLAGKAKAGIGEGEKLLGKITDHPDIARAGRRLEVEGKVEEVVGG